MKDNQPEIADYDEFNYDYTHYWDFRSYENQAEIYALDKLLKNCSGKWFIDIGGSFGRHIERYNPKYENSVIADYSIKALKQAKTKIKKKNIKNTYLVAANVYNLPFKENTFAGGIMIRVLHHLEKPEIAFKEIRRCFRTNSTFILEFANKMHIKNRIKFLVKPNNSTVGYGNNLQTLKIPQSENPEGTKRESQGIMLNFHPKFIEKKLKSASFKINSSQAISFLRIPQIKRILPPDVINTIEKVLQKLLAATKITPSIILKTKVINEANNEADLNPKISSKIEDILVCPKCKGDLEFTKHHISCKKCKEVYQIDDEIFDLRYPKPQYETK